MPQDISLVLVDGSSYLFRAFHAMPDLTNKDGHPTGAIRGVISMLRKLRSDYPDSTIAVVFDAKGKTFRNDIYPEYKANRPPMEPELATQIAPIFEIIEAMGLPLLTVDNVEADDVIGTLAEQATAAGLNTLISTSDKDMAQLVNDHVTLFDSMSDRLTDANGVVEKFGVRPEQIIDYLALVGDTSDNIPGIPKVGPKTAAKWLAQHNTLEGIIANAEAVKGVVGQNLRDNVLQLPLAQELATIKTDIQLDVAATELKSREPDTDQLQKLFEHWQFRTFLRELQQESGVEPTREPDHDGAYQTVSTPYELNLLIGSILKTTFLSLHIEVEERDSSGPRLCGIAISAKPKTASYIPIGHFTDPVIDTNDQPEQLSQDVVLSALTPVLEDPGISKIGSDLKACWKTFRALGIRLRGLSRDVLLLSYLADNLSRGGHGTAALASRHLDWKLGNRQDLVGTGKKRILFSQVPIREAGKHCCQLADANFRISEALHSELHHERTLLDLYRRIDLPLSLALARMESHGVLLNVVELKTLSGDLAKRMSALTNRAYQLSGTEFVLNSPKQLADVLYDKLALPAPRESKSGHRSTAEPVLEKLIKFHDLPSVVLEYRKLATLKATFADALPLAVDRTTGRAHTTYNQVVASSSRVASYDPNLQNIPNRTEDGRKIRHAFVAPRGYKLLAADYSQIELRLMAHASEDEGLIRAFREEHDVHRATAAEVFDKNVDAVSEEDRQRAKAINFGLIYGMSSFGLSERLGLTRAEAKRYHDRYFERYPKVKEFMEATKQQAREKGYVETFLGRRLYVANIKSRVPAQRTAAERTAINAPIQGGAADVIKLATIAMDNWLTETDVDAKMIMQVHDELVFEVAENAVSHLADMARKIMTSAADLLVPLVVHVGYGSNWEAAH